MTKYYMINDNDDRGVVVKSTGKQENKKIEVNDELGNGPGWVYLEDKSKLVEISKADYDLIIACNEDWTYENAEKVSNKIKEILDNQ
ncbi:hypothetical protein [Viridibacillus arvi]|uniref:hypothetical protein n=1 Tax=Viridibacillus arvi TaxID=263475 RepID=UPI0034CDA5EA